MASWPRRFSAHPVARPITPPPMTATFTPQCLSDPVPQDADPFDLQLDLVAALEPTLVAMLEDAAGADGARAEHVARPQLRVLRSVGEDRLPRVIHVAEVPARALLAVHARDHLQPQVAELVGCDDDRTERGGEVLAFRRPEADSHLLALQVARRPVVHDRKAADRSACADDGGDLELVVERLRAVRIRDFVLGAVDRRGVREVEGGELVPLGRHFAAAGDAARVRDVSLEGVEIAYRRRPPHRGEQPHLVQRVLRMLARVAAAGEERLQRLRRELDHAVALDPPRPPSNVVVEGSEHAKPHGARLSPENVGSVDPSVVPQLRQRSAQPPWPAPPARRPTMAGAACSAPYGSVCTITSAIPGRSARMRSSIWLARACAAASGVPGSRDSVRYASRPSSLRRKRSSRGSAPVSSRTMRSTSWWSAAAGSTLRPSPVSASGSRCVCTASTSGTDSTIARSISVAISCASSSGSSPGSLRWSETSVALPTRSTVRLWISRTRGTR